MIFSEGKLITIITDINIFFVIIIGNMQLFVLFPSSSALMSTFETKSLFLKTSVNDLMHFKLKLVLEQLSRLD